MNQNQESIQLHQKAARLAKGKGERFYSPGLEEMCFVARCPMCEFGARDSKDRCCHTGRRGDR